MPYLHSSPSPYLQMDNPALLNILKTTSTTTQKPSRSSKSSKGGGIKGLLQMFKLFPMLTSGCKMVALLNRPRRASLPDRATIITIFGYKTGKVTLSIQENPNSIPIFISELPISTSTFQKEIQSDIVRIALESETIQTKTNRKKRLMDEMVWSVYCNGRKMGYAIRRRTSNSSGSGGGMTEEEAYVMRSLKGVSMGAGVLPRGSAAEVEEEMTYLRMRFERGIAESEDSEAFYMINPEEGGETEFSIFFLRGNHN